MGDEADQPDQEKLTSEANIDKVENCIEVYGDNEMNMILNDLIGRVKKLKLKSLR